MGKIYGYCRVAKACTQEITEQMALIDSYCTTYGLNVDEYFCDNGVSGLDIGEKLQELFDVMENGDTVIIKDIARLTRSNVNLTAFINQFEDNGVELICVSGDKVNASSMKKWLNDYATD